MKLLRKYIKPIAAFLLLNTVYYIAAPSVAHALTAGPTAPEYNSFEPVDTTDMVNLATGDFVYNIPLLEVPGPAGGYPLSLSYHAGIQPNEEASWVGLGWTLNPGAITRTVNGYPDDQNEALRTRRDFNEGGVTRSFSIGLGLPGANFGLSISNDTFQGFGVGQSFSANYKGIGASFSSNSNGGFSTSVSVNPFGLKDGPDPAKPSSNLKVSAGIASGSNKPSAFGGVGFSGDGFSLGSSISSQGLSGSATIKGYSAFQSNSRSNNWTVNSSSVSVPIPLSGPFSVTLGYKYTRYFIDETADIRVIGALHSEKATEDKDYDNTSFDSYSLIDPEEDFITQEAEKSRGGSFPAYDQYTVSSQGVSGAIRPYTFGVGSLFRQNLKKIDNENEYEIEYLPSTGNLPKSNFRFLNDFSNAITFDENLQLNKNTNDLSLQNGGFSVEAEGFLSQKSKLLGSKNVEHYFNSEIASGLATSNGFIDYQINSERDEENKGDQIGGYKITNESGVTYHYALPVYASKEYTLNQSRQNPKNADGTEGIFTEYFHDKPYAYTWLLTAVTGPDFVDRGNTGVLDESDWGYWVKFDYGRWSKEYQWRNPSTGFHVDIDSDFENYSSGEKELYYLNSVETSSHIAFFEKELRADAKGVANVEIGGFGIADDIYTYSDPSAINQCVQNCLDDIANLDCNDPDDPNCGSGGISGGDIEFCQNECNNPNNIATESLSYTRHSVSSLKLSNIYLVEKKQIAYNEIKDLNAPNYNHSFTWLSNNNDSEIFTTNVHEGENVLDVHDLDLNRSGNQTYRDYLTSKSLSVISLDHSYNLQDDNGGLGGVPNSFDLPGDMYVQSPTGNENNVLLGKLTLEGLTIKGKQGISLIPGMSFAYDKNPVYQKEHYDIWGFYKSDYQDLGTENLSRAVTPTSAENVDAWSLSSIKTSLGASIEVNYESDSYQKPALLENRILPVKAINLAGNKISLFDDGITLNEFLKVGDEIDVLIFNEQRIQAGLAVARDYKTFSYKLRIDQIEDTPSNKSLIISPNIPLYQFNTSGSNNTNHFLAGNISIANDFNQSGGGLRVNEIAINDPLTNVIRSTQYDYSDAANPDLGSGVTSFEPFGLDVAIYNPEIGLIPEDKKKIYEDELNNKFSELLLISRELQAPGVVYGNVSVTSEVNGEKVPGKQVFEFETFKKNFVERVGATESSQIITPVVIRDFMSRTGNLKSVKSYDINDELLDETKTIYQYDLDLGNNDNFRTSLASKFQNQGVVQEAFSEKKRVFKDDAYETISSLSRKESYPSVIVGQEATNFRTGITSSSKNLAFDFYSGQITETYSHDIYGRKYLSKSIPAYRLKKTNDTPAYPFMGLGGYSNNKNMLSQEGANFTYLLDENFTLENGNPTEQDRESLVSASVQLWNEGTGGEANVNSPIGKISQNSPSQGEHIYRRYSSATYIGNGESNADGTHNIIDLDNPFYLSNNGLDLASQSAAGWRKNGSADLYDINGHILEVTDINDVKASAKFDNRFERVYTSATNVGYSDFAFSSAEDIPIGNKLGGDVLLYTSSSNTPTIVDKNDGSVHSGNKAIEISGNKETFIFSGKIHENRPLKVSVWTTNPNISLKYSIQAGVSNQVVSTRMNQVGNWYQLSGTISANNLPSENITVKVQALGEVAIVDDFMVFPVDAGITSYVYNEWGELSDIINRNNLSTHYEYDAMGRLKSVWTESFQYGKKKISDTDYHYANQQ